MEKIRTATEAGFMSRQCDFFAEQLIVQSMNVEILEPSSTECRLPLPSFSTPHLHDSWELKLFVGSVPLLLPEKNMEILLPGLVVVPPNTVHSGTIISGSSKILMLAISLDRNGLLLTYAGSQQCHFVMESAQLAHLSALVFTTPENIYATIHSSLRVSGNKSAKSYGINLLRFFLTALARELLPRESSTKPSLPPNPDLVTRAVQYMTVYYYMPTLTVREIAEHAGVSSGHLSVLFRSREKTTIRKRLVKIRLERAQELLLSGRYSVKEASCLTGWNDQLYFSKVFKKYYGTCPKNFSSTF